MITPRAIELLAPARNADIAIEAIKHGADAVYMGGPGFGARASAGNTIADIARVVDYAHRFNVGVYVTLNTIIYDEELCEVSQLINDLYNIGVNALIVQDMSLLRMNIPPIALHASTQCDTRSVAKARFLQEVGFSQIVLARELSLAEINEIYKNVDVPLEAFVHGALCVSYSGDCQAGYVTMNRSANRGECPQMCRQLYTMTDVDGKIIVKDKHLLSLKDMNRSAFISDMIEAGVSSFKIEGRLKDMSYVKNTVAFYRQAIDEVIVTNPDKYYRASKGKSEINFIPKLEKSFNRGFTDYYLTGVKKNQSIASINTPKSIGELVGKVKSINGDKIIAQLDKSLSNGDGLGYFDKNGVFQGFRLNKIENNILFPATKVDVGIGTLLYRNKDKKWDDILSKETAKRRIAVDVTLRIVEDLAILEMEDERGNKVTATHPILIQEAETPQTHKRLQVLNKLGATIYKANKIEDKVATRFISMAILTDLRRRATDLLDAAQRMTYRYTYIYKENVDAKYINKRLDYHENVANKLSRKFYESHGAEIDNCAVEVEMPVNIEEVQVMNTRYCLRRELGYCLKTKDGVKLKSPLCITTGNNRFRLDFDCKNCQMKVIYLVSKNKNL